MKSISFRKLLKILNEDRFGSWVFGHGTTVDYCHIFGKSISGVVVTENGFNVLYPNPHDGATTWVVVSGTRIIQCSSSMIQFAAEGSNEPLLTIINPARREANIRAQQVVIEERERLKKEKEDLAKRERYNEIESALQKALRDSHFIGHLSSAQEEISLGRGNVTQICISFSPSEGYTLKLLSDNYPLTISIGGQNLSLSIEKHKIR